VLCVAVVAGSRANDQLSFALLNLWHNGQFDLAKLSSRLLDAVADPAPKWLLPQKSPLD
jgi:hypothetical protein